MIEEWRQIPGYDFYEASTLGNIRSLDRMINDKMGRCYLKKGRTLNFKPSKDGYIRLTILGKKYSVHQLIAITFLGHVRNGFKLVVDHIDGNPLNNRLDNLQLITNRDNVSKESRGTSKYQGVCWNRFKDKWKTAIQIDGVVKHLGYYIYEFEAFMAYEKAKRELVN